MQGLVMVCALPCTAACTTEQGGTQQQLQHVAASTVSCHSWKVKAPVAQCHQHCTLEENHTDCVIVTCGQCDNLTDASNRLGSEHMLCQLHTKHSLHVCTLVCVTVRVWDDA